MKPRLTCLILFSILWQLTIGQQAEVYSESYTTNLRHFTTDEGLSNNVVYCFAKDSRGVMWIGTHNGLNRFDGRSFKTYFKKDGLLDSGVYELFFDGHVLWCLHRDPVTGLQNKITLFDPINEQAISFEDYFTVPLPFDPNTIYDSQTVPFATSDSGFVLLRFYSSKKESRYFKCINKSSIKEIPFVPHTENIRGIFENGDVFLSKGSTSNFEFRILDSLGNDIMTNESPSNKNAYIFPILTGDEAYWFYYNYKLWSIPKDAKVDFGNFENEAIPLNPTGFTVSFPWRHITYSPRHGAFWIENTSYDEKVLLSKENEILLKLKLYENETQGAGFIEDNIIWQNTEKGFFQIELKDKKFQQILKGKTGEGARGITEIEGQIYVTSYGGTYRMSHRSAEATKLKEGGIISIPDQHGNIWLSHDYYIYVLDSASREVIREYKYSGLRETWSMVEDRKGIIWTSCLGVWGIDHQEENVFEIEYNAFEDLKSSTVYYFYQEDKDNYLLCSTSGLYRMNIDQGIVARYWSGGEGEYYIPADDIRHLLYNEEGNTYWLAAYDEGLVQWNPVTTESRTHKFNRTENNMIHAVYADDFGFLWLSTQKGIVQFEVETGLSKVYSSKDGTTSDEFNRTSHFQHVDGTIYFGSVDGVTVFHPKNFAREINKHANAKVEVVEILQYVNKEKSLQNTTSSFFENGKIEVNSGDRFLTLKLTVDNYTENQNAVYYYRLKEESEDWVELSNNELFIGGLPYGKQMIEMKAVIENGDSTESILIPVDVQRPFYLKTWYFVLMFFLFLLGTLWFANWRTRRLKKQKQLLEQEVSHRTAKIEEQAETLRELDETKSRFFANVSHELRTPLTLIQGPIHSLQKMKTLDKTANALIAKAEQNVKNLMQMVNEILDITKLESGAPEVNESRIVFYTFLRRIISSFQSVADVKNIELTFIYYPPKELQILLDNRKVEKIINNVLTNALKFTPKGGRVAVTVESKNENLILKVEDNGCGIPEKDIPHVFDRFYQSRNTKKAEGGLGIGLALSQELVKLLKGKMWVESSTTPPDNGSTFYVQFLKKEVISMLSDADKESLSEEIVVNNEDKTKSVALSENGFAPRDESLKTVLLVEDNSDLREYIQFLLHPHYNIVTAENGKEALAVLRQPGTTCQLIISDVMMPIMDGFEFLQQVKAHPKWRSTPFVMLTARAELKDKLSALRIGVDDYLLKPFQEEELLVRMENLLQNAEERRDFSLAQPDNKDSLANNVNEGGLISGEELAWLEQVEKHVLKHITDNRFSVDFLAEQLEINRKTLYQRIKALTGLTPNTYIQTIRLQRAKKHLENGQYASVREAANDAGFLRPDYFSKLFVKAFGKAPVDYF